MRYALAGGIGAFVGTCIGQLFAVMYPEHKYLMAISGGVMGGFIAALIVDAVYEYGRRR